MAIETGLEGKPIWVSAAVAIVIAGGLFFIGKLIWFDDMQSGIVSREAKLQELQQKITSGRVAKSRLPQFREEVRRLELDLGRLLKILPTQRKTEDLLRRFRGLGEQGDLNLLRLTPANPTPVDFYSEWPIRMRIEGTYHELALFLDRISQLRRIINIENLQIRSRRQADHHTVSSQFTAKTFIYNDPNAEEEEL